ncbi:hypothetical protein L9F63_013960, partial [Diploptera punctata]
TPVEHILGLWKVEPSDFLSMCNTCLMIEVGVYAPQLLESRKHIASFYFVEEVLINWPYAIFSQRLFTLWSVIPDWINAMILERKRVSSIGSPLSRYLVHSHMGAQNNPMRSSVAEKCLAIVRNLIGMNFLIEVFHLYLTVLSTYVILFNVVLLYTKIPE